MPHSGWFHGHGQALTSLVAGERSREWPGNWAAVSVAFGTTVIIGLLKACRDKAPQAAAFKQQKCTFSEVLGAGKLKSSCYRGIFF